MSISRAIYILYIPGDGRLDPFEGRGLQHGGERGRHRRKLVREERERMSHGGMGRWRPSNSPPSPLPILPPRR